MALFYADASALVKLVRDEAESDALRTYLEGADLVSSELVLTEVPRAVRRAAALDPDLPLDLLLGRAGQVLDAVALATLDRALLAVAGALVEPALRALDAIHVADRGRLASARRVRDLRRAPGRRPPRRAADDRARQLILTGPAEPTSTCRCWFAPPSTTTSARPT